METILQYAWMGLAYGSLFGLLAMGLSIILAVTKVFHFFHAFVLTASAYLTYTFYTVLGWPLIATLFVCLAFGILSGCLTEVCLYRVMRKSNASQLIIFVASLGLTYICVNCITLIYGNDTLLLVKSSPNWKLGAVSMRPYDVATVILMLVSVIALELVLRRTNLGKALRAVASHAESAKIIGINVDRMFLYAFAIGSACAVLPGMVIALNTNIEPNMAWNLVLLSFTITITGAVGSPKGTALTGLMVGIPACALSGVVGANWQMTIVFAFLLAILLFKPAGLFGTKVFKMEV